ncbi:MAG: TlpA disulfide reductase family protein [Pseudobdellovibrionaceae bacterium]|jgi:thiol-disulfide isomerase/thioredoxin|nr:TlpA disulfide reductase family protein [Pseudobdellovibrionaceae bacterium]
MKNASILIVFILLGAGLTLWYDQDTTPDNISAKEIVTEKNMQAVPDFTISTLDGKSLTLGSLKGRIVVLNFWATWCAPCVVEFPKLVALAHANPDISMILLSSDTNTEAIDRFLDKQTDETKTYLKDPDIAIARDDKRKITADLFMTYKLPETLIINKKGELAHKIVGDTDWQGDEIRTLLESLREK